MIQEFHNKSYVYRSTIDFTKNWERLISQIYILKKEINRMCLEWEMVKTPA